MNHRPLIGISGPARGGKVAWWFTALAVYRAGGKPRRLIPGKLANMDDLDGLILGGGVDLDPSLCRSENPSAVIETFAKEPLPQRHPLLGAILLPTIYLLRRLFSLELVVSPDRHRDAFETRLVHSAISEKKPILGICRGAQLLNAVLGGSLHPEIRGFYTETPYVRSVLRRKKIHISPDSKLATLLPRKTDWVNSLHHQAVHNVAPSLKIVAWEDNNLVQAIEYPGDTFLLGVQWHPEFLPHSFSQQALFRALVQSARTPQKKTTSCP